MYEELKLPATGTPKEKLRMRDEITSSKLSLKLKNRTKSFLGISATIDEGICEFWCQKV